MRTRTYGLLAGMLGGLSAVLIGGGVMSPAAEVPIAHAQETPVTNTATVTTTTTTTPVTNTATVTTTTTTTATATATATTGTATNTPTTAPATATPTRTNTPVPTATTVPPTQGVPTQPSNAPINITLSGAQEVPPVSSPGSGRFLATAGTTSLSYTLTASGTTSGITMAHIHQGGPGVNGPIVADLMMPVPTGVGSVNNSGVITQADLKGPLAGNFAGFLTALRAGQLYVNVHTIQYPAGELRGNFPAPPAPPATGSSAVETSSGSQSMLYLAGALAGAGALAFGAGAFARRRG